MRSGQRYICANPLCRCEIEVIRESLNAIGNPKCCCGSAMRKPYAQPVFRELSRQPSAFGFVETKKKRGA